MGSRAAAIGVILLTVLMGACATTGNARPEPFPRPSAAAPPNADPNAEPIPVPRGVAPAVGPDVVRAALGLRGAPYAMGGSGPHRFDCSGLVQYVYRQAGIELPRTVALQFALTTAIPSAAGVLPGDLLFFKLSGEKPSHVAIATGDGRFVHAPSARGTVRVDTLSAPYWRERFQEARRVR